MLHSHGFGDTLLRKYQTTSWEDEIHDVLHASHDELCSGHNATKRTSYKVLQAGYYWTTLHGDVVDYFSKCDDCQRMG